MAASALPYYEIPAIPLGPVSLQPFGILVAIGVLLGAWVGRKRAAQLGIDENPIRTLTGYLLVFGFLGAHWFDALFYNWDRLVEHPLLFFKVWDGISSYGGFLGAAVGFAAFCKVHKVHRPLAYADITISGTLLGFTFGRLGCTLVYDHPGQPTDWWTGMEYPFGSLRVHGIAPGEHLHNLGFYEFVFLVVLGLVILAITRVGRRMPVGFIPGFVALNYGVVRFFLDYLRYTSTDPRYAGLTFAQWVSVATAVIGVVVLHRAFTGPTYVPPGGDDWGTLEKELDTTARETPSARGVGAKKKKPGGGGIGSVSKKKKRKKK